MRLRRRSRAFQIVKISDLALQVGEQRAITLSMKVSSAVSETVTGEWR
jgi:hypothetical protein